MSLPAASRRPLSGWGRTPVQECVAYRPERLGEVEAIVARAPESSVLARGLGRSYGDASLNAGAAVALLERLDRLLAFDEASGVLHCEAGVSLSDVLDHFLPRGWAPAVTPGTRCLSLGGAIAADVHGKNHHRDGTIASQVVDFRLLTATGEVRTCSRQEDAEIFWATLGGMGLTGVVLDLRLRLRPIETTYVEVHTERARDLDAVLERMSASDPQHAYSVAWIDGLARGRSLGRSVLMRADHARLADLPLRLRSAPRPWGSRLRLRVPFELPAKALSSPAMRAFNAAYWVSRRPGHRLATYEDYFYPLDALLDWNRVYGRRGVVQYQVVVPPESAREALSGILERVAARGLASFLAVLKSMGEASPGPLSFPRPGYTLALDFPNTGSELVSTIAQLDELVLRHGGRVYLAKDSCLRPELLGEMYPRLREFRALKARIDPEQRFSSSLARRLGITKT